MNLKTLTNYFTFKNFLWTIYAGVLVVITPHTQWMFSRFEPANLRGLSWVAAVVFEATIFAVTHLLVEHIAARKPSTFNFDKERIRKVKIRKWELGELFTWWPLFRYRWLNAYTMLLGLAVFISGFANLSHAVEYGQSLTIVQAWSIPYKFFTLAFGGILPLVNLLFAAVIAQVDDAQNAENPELEKANGTISDLRKQLRESEQARKSAELGQAKAEEDRRQAEINFAALGKLMVKLFAEDKKQRILAIHEQWPRLPGSAIAIMADASPSHVSEVLSESSEVVR
jgi:hypothetical protein